MNIIVLTFITILCSVHSSSEKTQINELFDDTRQLLQRSNNELADDDGVNGRDFTNLDIFEFENEHVEFCGVIWCIRANITQGTIKGLGGYEIHKSKFDSDGTKVSLDLDINFPSLEIESEYYEMEGNIMGAFPLSGKGKLQFEIKHLRFWTKIEMRILEDGPTIDEFKDPGFSLQDILCRTEFDGNIDDIFNTMVEELVPDYLNRFNKSIATYYSDVLKELLNPILRM